MREDTKVLTSDTFKWLGQRKNCCKKGGGEEVRNASQNIGWFWGGLSRGKPDKVEVSEKNA